MPDPKPDDAVWVVETVNDEGGFCTALRAEGDVRAVGDGGSLSVFHNRTFGKVLTLEGGIQLTTADEFIYHEMMAHVPLFAHGAARSVLIVGGGDGGVAREVLRHPVGRVTLVEIDACVVATARDEFASIGAGAFDDPRLDLIFGDGAAYVGETDLRFDVVIVDSTDPVGDGAVLFEPSFYANCRRILRRDGVLVTQSGMPFLTSDWFAQHAATLRATFDDVAFFLTTVPSYTGGPMAHGFVGSPAAHHVTRELLAARRAEIGGRMQYWTPAVHEAAFVLPPYIAQLVGD